MAWVRQRSFLPWSVLCTGSVSAPDTNAVGVFKEGASVRGSTLRDGFWAVEKGLLMVVGGNGHGPDCCRTNAGFDLPVFTC